MAGRPTDYNERYHPEWAKSLARQGLDSKQIAKEMGISRATLYNWQDEHPEFLDAVKEGKGPADAKVINSLFKRAIGFDYTEEKTVVEVGADGKPKPLKIEKVTKHVAPEVSAICFWLKNRLPKDWRDVHKLEHGGQVKHDHELSNIEEMLTKHPELLKAVEEAFIASICERPEGSTED